MQQHSQKTWIMAADDVSAHIFARQDGHLKSVSDLFAEDQAEIEMTNDTVGRTGSSPTERHKYEPSMDQSRQRELSFAHQIGILLNDAASRQAFDQLVIVAAPKMLGYLRGELDGQAKQHVVAEVNKEFANLKGRALEEKLLGILHDSDIMSRPPS